MFIRVLQRYPGDQSVWRSPKLVGNTGIGQAIALPGSCKSGELMVCSCKQGIVVVRMNTESLF